jgi:putative oxygen-independent coproporphyrinogen III oxidase
MTEVYVSSRKERILRWQLDNVCWLFQAANLVVVLRLSRQSDCKARFAVSQRDWGLYIHFPYCQSKCPYCAFNSQASSFDEEDWLQAILHELSWHCAWASDPIAIDTVFFGGGTPSLIKPQTIETILAFCVQHLRLHSHAEITLEANPGSLEMTQCKAFRSLGINRLSIGVQAFSDSGLQQLGRAHSVHDAIQAITLAQALFDNFSIDLIYGRPQQSWKSWQEELRMAESLAPPHLSLYQLTIEPNTLFGFQKKSGQLIMPSASMEADFAEWTEQWMERLGYFAYEISNYARPSFECRHNMNSWLSGNFMGVGPGAHGRITRQGIRWATQQITNPIAWRHAIRDTGSGMAEQTQLDARQHVHEAMMMGLRLREGVPITHLTLDFEQFLNQSSSKKFQQLGLLLQTDTHWKTTRSGRWVLDALLRELLV